MKEIWENFWWKWNHPHILDIRYGSGPQGFRTFRWQRLFNIILITGLIILFIIIIRK